MLQQKQAGTINSLQMLLRNISGEYDDVTDVIPDGIFGAQTLEAVQSFQTRFGLIPTGTVDFETWNAIVDVSQGVDEKNNPGTPVLAFNEQNIPIIPGETSNQLYVIQAMIKALSNVISNIEDVDINGVHDVSSVNAVKSIQKFTAMEQNGIISVEFYNNLTQLYEVYVTRARI